MTPTQLRPQCGHNWECSIKLTIPVELPIGKSAAKFGL
jgi:hypothetical protein